MANLEAAIKARIAYIKALPDDQFDAMVHRNSDVTAEAKSNMKTTHLLHSLLENRELLHFSSITEHELESTARSIFPNCYATWIKSEPFPGSVLRLSFNNDNVHTIRFTLDNKLLTGFSLNAITPSGPAARRLGEAVEGTLSKSFGLPPQRVTVNDSGSYSWQQSDFEIEVAIHGADALSPHGVLIAFAPINSQSHFRTK